MMRKICWLWLVMLLFTGWRAQAQDIPPRPNPPRLVNDLAGVLLGNEAGTLSYTAFPTFKPEYLVEDEFAYPVSINGKMKMNLNLSLTLAQPEVEIILLADEQFLKFLDGKAPKKIIFVKGKIINVVV